MLKHYLLQIIALVLILTNSVQGQNEAADAAEQKKIISMMESFNQDASKLSSKGNLHAEKLLSYTSPNFFYQTTTINIMNVVNRQSANKELISLMLREMRQSSVISKRKINGYSEFSIRGNLGTFSYSVDYELFESERLINKGRQDAFVIVRKNPNNEWKIEALSVFNVDDKTYKSTCICEIYETKGLQSIITETILPDGHEADVVEDKFSIDESSDPRAVRHGFRDYFWASTGSIYKRNIDGSQGDQIGMAKSRQELLLTLLKKEVYPDRCESVIRKLK